MPVQELDLDLPARPDLPAEVAGMLAEAERRIDRLFDSNRNRRFPRYLPSNAALLYAALDDLTRRDVPPGRVYCEWGSGVGAGTCLAAMLGYEAWGIEIEPELVKISRDLAADFDLTTRILNTSYFPDGYDSFAGQGGEDLVGPETFAGRGETVAPYPAYEGMGFDTDEIDLFFVYPWPGQQELMQDLFEALAADGAILVTYYGDADICAYRKVLGDEERL